VLPITDYFQVRNKKKLYIRRGFFSYSVPYGVSSLHLIIRGASVTLPSSPMHLSFLITPPALHFLSSVKGPVPCRMGRPITIFALGLSIVSLVLRIADSGFSQKLDGRFKAHLQKSRTGSLYTNPMHSFEPPSCVI
jgi:hypothetical protein